MFVRALLVLCLFGAALSRDFPTFEEIGSISYTTEVQLSLVKEQATVYVKEYYDNIDHRGMVSIYMQGSMQSVYYDNSTNEVLDVNSTYCKATDADISDFVYTPLYHGWISTNPLVIGPSAPLAFAQKFRSKIEDRGTETVRDIECDKFELKVENGVDNYTIQYYLAPQDWTTPYKSKKMRVPIRIRIVGLSARYTGDTKIFVEVDQISDFAFFKPWLDDLNDLLPPIGIGCKSKQKTDLMPAISEIFQFSAESVNRLKMEEQVDVDVEVETMWYDYQSRLARVDRYTKKNGYKSALYDFKGGAAYYLLNDGSCQISTLRNTELVIYDLGMSGRMMNPKEALMLDGDFYEMGIRTVRGIRCKTYESVAFDQSFRGILYHKLVVTVFFTEGFTKVGVNGEMEGQIPVQLLINGWGTPTHKNLSLTISMFGFDDVIWPAMYSTFRLQRCYTKPETKSFFVLVMEVGAAEAAKLEGQNNMIVMQLRTEIARVAKVPELRIPYLKVDYKPAGVFVQGVIVERPPALIQFFFMETAPTVTKDPDLKVIVEASTLEECSYACVDEGDFPCKGFYFCNKACFLKSTDPFENEDNEKETDLGVCDEYIRTERDSTNFREAYLAQALEYLETAVLNQTISLKVLIPEGEEVVKIQDIVIGDGPYIGVDTGDKPFTIASEWRKLDASLSTTQVMKYADTLTDCYKQCKEAGSACASFSFCPESKKDDKECLITSELVIKGTTKDTDLVPDKTCNVYHLKYSDYFQPYPEKVALLPGDKSIKSVTSLEKCAQNCRMEKDFLCRGFEYCRSRKTCTLHKKHILDFKVGETGISKDNLCVHYAARFIADYMDLGPSLIDDNSNVRYGTSLDECAKICSEELKQNCKSFNYCPGVDFSDATCALSGKLLRDDGVKTYSKDPCMHYEKRDEVHDWDKKRASQKMLVSGFTTKGFTGLVVGMLAFGLIIGIIGFVAYSYFRSRGSDSGMAIKFMNREA